MGESPASRPASGLPTTADEAPALTRGLALLAWLNREGTSSLARIARANRWPKASALRLLRALAAAGAVARSEDGQRWRAVQRLVDAGGGELALRRRCAATMVALARRARQTVELYRVEGATLVMVDRAEPEDAEVSVRARIGHVPPGEEASAVQAVLRAFAASPPTGVTTWRWHERARTPVPRTFLERWVIQVRRDGAAADPGINNNGVRRFAAPITGDDGGLVGVLVIAHAGALPAGAEDARWLRQVVSAAATLSRAG